MVRSEWANMCLRLAIKSVLAFTRFHCVVAVGFGSVIVTGSEATQKCFCEISAPHSPVVQNRRKPHPPHFCNVEAHLQLGCCAPFGRAGSSCRRGGQRWKPFPQSCLCLVDGRTACPCIGKLEHASLHCFIWFISAWESFVALGKWLRKGRETTWIPPVWGSRGLL